MTLQRVKVGQVTFPVYMVGLLGQVVSIFTISTSLFFQWDTAKSFVIETTHMFPSVTRIFKQ